MASRSRHIAPLLNPNHLTAYLNIGFCLALGMTLDRRVERLRPIAIAVALLLGVLVMTQIWIGVARRDAGHARVRRGVHRHSHGPPLAALRAPRPSVKFVLPTLLVVAAGVWRWSSSGLLSPDAVDELNSGDVSKIRIAMDGLRLVPHHALFGVGRGAYEVDLPSGWRTDARVHQRRDAPGEHLVVQWRHGMGGSGVRR